ncbi:universal stress protein [Streptomyces spectabilis]|uniref:Nucleotide-binding universal stress UspA family protein n=1 Tax=Streptomyces spectabilis TaxID=68270 RepID=A0A5P2X5P9_STRST|nr:universal stress protein [Streptomyces spectabilis]MBB5101095.1 nucleotide-binding universal stress UspA family protein [Streptomyces spectabilis]MCI3900304.1 universal stress protein [Streptomyces spectabilis]QEV57896.1 universal stress protein [Streptomyces spectabilis]GGV09335.1 universal stress protein [Streptomyces spectabilis]
MTRAIAVGVDGSAESLAAADWAAAEAALRGAPLRIVHAWLPQSTDVTIARSKDELATAADAFVREAVTRVSGRHPDLTITSEVVQATPVDTLLGEAERSGMLVLGSRGHGALLGFLLGSYGQQVIADAAGPVVSVRAGTGTGAAGPDGAGEVVVGQHGEPEDSEAVLRFAFEAAAAHGAALRAVRAWTLPPLYAYNTGVLDVADQAGGLEPLEQQALTRALAPWRERFPDVPVTEHVEIGSAGQVLLSATADAGLLVVGRKTHRSPIGTRIGSVAHAALHHAGCPVAVVPPA